MKRMYLSLTSSGSFDRVIGELEHYRDRLHENCEAFVNRLIEVGIDTAEDNTGQYAGYILFTKKVVPSEDGCVGVLIGRGKIIVKEWYTDKKKTKKRSYPVNPLLLAEFGSGWLAKNLDNIPGVGQGTMPHQRHAYDVNGWWWFDDNGEKHHSIGESPTYPMHSAVLAMLFEIDRIGREVFDNG